MKLPEYVTVDEVKRVCKSIGLSDWSGKTDPVVSEEASVILEIVNKKSMEIPVKDFHQGWRSNWSTEQDSMMQM